MIKAIRIALSAILLFLLWPVAFGLATGALTQSAIRLLAYLGHITLAEDTIAGWGFIPFLAGCIIAIVIGAVHINEPRDLDIFPSPSGKPKKVL